MEVETKHFKIFGACARCYNTGETFELCLKMLCSNMQQGVHEEYKKYFLQSYRKVAYSTETNYGRLTYSNCYETKLL